jgi:hypothetical protein
MLLVAHVANLRAAHRGGGSPALRLTRYFCNRGLEQPAAAMRQLLLVVRCVRLRRRADMLGLDGYEHSARR